VPLIDLKFLNELAAGDEELQIGGTAAEPSVWTSVVPDGQNCAWRKTNLCD
jgi:hypothetical protein